MADLFFAQSHLSEDVVELIVKPGKKRLEVSVLRHHELRFSLFVQQANSAVGI